VRRVNRDLLGFLEGPVLMGKGGQRVTRENLDLQEMTEDLAGQVLQVLRDHLGPWWRVRECQDLLDQLGLMELPVYLVLLVLRENKELAGSRDREV